MASTLEVFHADSLAGPLREIRGAFEARHPGIAVDLVGGVSNELARRILDGERCDVLAASSPSVIADRLLRQPIAGSGREAASWYVVFSANEMVVITAKGNPLGIRTIGDLARAEVRFARATGEKDLATRRTVEFLERGAVQEGAPDLAERILERAPADPANPLSVPDTIDAVTSGRANASVTYYSAALAARHALDIVRFSDAVNMSHAIRNVVTIPGTAHDVEGAIEFVRFLLSAEAASLLREAGQPPIVPAIRYGAVPAELGSDPP